MEAPQKHGEQMDFDLEIVERTCITQDVEDVARMGTIGHFGDARTLSAKTLEKYLKAFPIAVEVLRLFYNQGDHAGILAFLNGDFETPGWSSKQRGALSLIMTICRASLTRAFGDEEPRPRLGDFVQNTHIQNADDEDVLLLVLQLRVLYLEHELREQPLPKERFIFKLSSGKGIDTCTLLLHLLGNDQFWAAENVLEICFRRTAPTAEQVPIKRLWLTIGRFVDSNTATADEQTLWAQAALLQTFCEGTLRRRVSTHVVRHGGEIVWSWEKAMGRIAQIRQALNTKGSDNIWRQSRAFVRQQLIEIDETVRAVAGGTHVVHGEDLAALKQLKTQAEFNHDRCLEAGIQWRIEVLANNKNPEDFSTPMAPVPFQLYLDFHAKLMERQKAKQPIYKAAMEAWKNAMANLSTQLGDFEYDDTTSSMSVEYDRQKLRRSPPPVTKRILLVGHTGTGKSTLLRTLTNKYAATSNDRACTQTIQRENCQWSDGTIIECIDTPGFGDPYVRDYDNLRNICTFLHEESVAGRCLHSVFYLIDVSNNRNDRSTIQQARVFKELVGPEAWRNVCFIYTRGVSQRLANADRPSRKKRGLEQDAAIKNHRDLFNEARSKGALFEELGLDENIDIIKFYDAVDNIQANFSASDDATDIEGRVSPNQEGDTFAGPVQATDNDTSNEIYQPADPEQVQRIVQQMLKRDGPVILECQREMFQHKMPFRETQAALVYEEDIRAGWDSTRQTEDNHHRSRMAAETSLSETRQEIADLRERRARNERENKDREAEAREKQFAEAEEKAKIEREEAERLRLEEIVNLRARYERQFAEAEQKAKLEREAAERQRLEEIDDLRAQRIKDEEERKARDTEFAEATRRAEARAAEKAEDLRKWLEEKRRKEEKERAALNKRLEEAEKKEKAEKAQAEEFRKKEETAAKLRKDFEREIEAIENSPGWTPRYIVQNKTDTFLHLSMYNAILLNAHAGFKNYVRPGKFATFHVAPGLYGIEGYLCVGDNAPKFWHQVGKGLSQNAAYLSAMATLGWAVPGIIAVGGIAAVCAVLWSYIGIDSKQEDVRITGFESDVKPGENQKVIIKSRPGAQLAEPVEAQMLIMETTRMQATREGKLLFLFHGPEFSLGRTTRLQICAGPSARRATRDNGSGIVESYREYVFDSATEPLHIKRIDKFTAGGLGDV